MRLIILALVLLTAACSKNAQHGEKLTGSWRQYYIYEGGFSGASYNVPPDSSFILTLNKDFTYTYNRNGRMENSGTYSVIPFSNGGIDTKALIFSDRPGYHYLIDLQTRRLKLTLVEMEANPSSSYAR